MTAKFLLDFFGKRNRIAGPQLLSVAAMLKEEEAMKVSVKRTPRSTAKTHEPCILITAPVTVELDPVQQEQQRIAEEAATVLGYTAYSRHVAGKFGGELGRALRELGIQPFTVESVEKYKKEVAAELRRKHPSTYYAHVTVEWKRCSLSTYNRKVEPFILSTAIEVKKRVPAAEFFVEEVRVESKPYDPFLIVKLGEESYYIGVWDEPKFEKTLF